jgi:hypothetical protein
MSHKKDILAEKPAQDMEIDVLPIAITTGLEAQPFIPILLRLSLKTPQPPVLENLVQKRKKNRQDRIMEPFVISLRPQCMNSLTVGTEVALHPQAKGEALKVSPHIAMAPKTAGLTGRTLLRPGPRKIFAFLNQPLYIYRKMEYQ